MTDSFTPSLGLTKQQTGTNTNVWGDIHNEGFIALVDDAISGRTEIDVTSSNVTLTSTPGTPDEARAMHLVITASAASGNREVILPTKEKLYILANDGSGAAVTFKTLLGGGVKVEQNEREIVFVDEVADQVRQVQVATGGGGAAVSEAGPFTRTFSVVADATAGSSTFDHATNHQGNIGWTSMMWNAGVTVASTLFSDGPLTGTFPLDDMPNLRAMDQVTMVLENGTPVEAFARVRVNGTGVDIFRADGVAWLNGSQRIILPIDSVFAMMYGRTIT